MRFLVLPQNQRFTSGCGIQCAKDSCGRDCGAQCSGLGKCVCPFK